MALQSLRRLRRLAALPVRQLFCSHNGRVWGSAEPLKAKLAYWEQIQQQSVALRRQGLSASQIARRLLGKDGLTEWITRGDVSRENLVTGLLRE